MNALLKHLYFYSTFNTHYNMPKKASSYVVFYVVGLLASGVKAGLLLAFEFPKDVVYRASIVDLFMFAPMYPLAILAEYKFRDSLEYQYKVSYLLFFSHVQFILFKTFSDLTGMPVIGLLLSLLNLCTFLFHFFTLKCK